MKYSETSLDLAISTLLPHVKKAKELNSNIQHNRVALLKDVAVEYFLKTTPPTQEEMVCFSVARQAISELSKDGVLNFGIKELSEEIDAINQVTASTMQSPCCLN